MAERNTYHNLRDYNSRRVFFDTNALLDAVDERRPGSEAACKALQYCNGGGDMGLVAPMSLKDVYYILGKQRGEALARDAINYLMGLFIVEPFGAADCMKSIKSDEPDFEDGLIRACAELNEATFILTRDKNAFRHSTVRSLTCEEYTELIAGELPPTTSWT